MYVSLLKFSPILVSLIGVTAALAQDSQQVSQGKAVYAEFCTLCHGADGKRGEGFQSPIWGEGSFIATKFGSADKMIEYMQLMPFNDPTLIIKTAKNAVYRLRMPRNQSVKTINVGDNVRARGWPMGDGVMLATGVEVVYNKR